MYASRLTQLIVGLFALAGIAALAILSLDLGRIELIPKPGYTLYANFDNIAGLKSGDRVEISGVQVGKVTGISLSDYRARVAMHIDQGIAIDKDAIAGVKSSGIIGDKYVAIQPGPSDDILKSGGTIFHTQSAFVLEDAVGQFINNAGSGGNGSNSGDKNGK